MLGGFSSAPARLMCNDGATCAASLQGPVGAGASAQADGACLRKACSRLCAACGGGRGLQRWHYQGRVCLPACLIFGVHVSDLKWAGGLQRRHHQGRMSRWVHLLPHVVPCVVGSTWLQWPACCAHCSGLPTSAAVVGCVCHIAGGSARRGAMHGPPNVFSVAMLTCLTLIFTYQQAVVREGEQYMDHPVHSLLPLGTA